MSNIITISRQFGSGGREIGKRLADELLYSYYDHELVKRVSDESGLAESYIERYSESSFTRTYPFTFGNAFSNYSQPPSDKVQIAQSKIMKELSEKSNCIIVGRCADYIIKEHNILKIFIYSSDIDARINRCYDKVPTDKSKSKKEMQKMILDIDKQRAKYYSYYTGQEWGNMSNYNLCIDTSAVNIKKAVATILEFCKLD